MTDFCLPAEAFVIKRICHKSFFFLCCSVKKTTFDAKHFEAVFSFQQFIYSGGSRSDCQSPECVAEPWCPAGSPIRLLFGIDSAVAVFRAGPAEGGADPELWPLHIKGSSWRMLIFAQVHLTNLPL